MCYNSICCNEHQALEKSNALSPLLCVQLSKTKLHVLPINNELLSFSVKTELNLNNKPIVLKGPIIEFT